MSVCDDPLAIGASSGGARARRKLLPRLPGDWPAASELPFTTADGEQPIQAAPSTPLLLEVYMMITQRQMLALVDMSHVVPSVEVAGLRDRPVPAPALPAAIPKVVKPRGKAPA